MLEKKKLIEELSIYLSVLQHFIRASSKNGLVDINLLSEDFVACVLNELHGWNLKNVNRHRSNTPAIDLHDEINRVGIQVTSTGGSKKVNETIEKLKDSEFAEVINELYIFSLKPKQKRYKIITDCPNVQFSEKNILDFDYVIREAKNKSVNPDNLKRIHHIVINNFAEWPRSVIQTAISIITPPDSSEEILIRSTVKDVLKRSLEEGESIKTHIIQLVEKNDIEKAKTLLDEFAKTKTSMAAQDFLDIANLYALMKSEQADLYYERAISLDSNTIKNANLYALGLMQRGFLDQAEVIFKSCLNKGKLSLSEREIIFGNLGFLYKNKGEFSKSIDSFEKAMVISEQTKNIVSRIKHLNGLGSCYVNLEKFEDSGTFFIQAKSILDNALDTSDDPKIKSELRYVKSNLLTNMAIRLKHLANVKNDAELLRSAEDILRQAIDLAETMNDPSTLLKHYGNLSNVLKELNRHDDARKYNKKAHDIATEQQDKRSEIVCFLNEGVMDLGIKDYSSAKMRFKDGIECNSEVYPKLHATLLANMALACKGLKEYQISSNYFKLAKELLIKLKQTESLKRLYDNYSLIQ